MFARAFLVVALLCAQASYAVADDRAVLIYPRERSWFRRVFYTSHQRRLVRQLTLQYRVDVHEQVADDAALFGVDIDGARLLVISGHGDAFSMHMAGRKRRTLDSSDRASLERFLSRLAPDATILLQSCHTGRGFAHVVKAAAGPQRRVIAAKGEVPWNGVAVTSLRPFDARILCDDRGLWDCTVRF